MGLEDYITRARKNGSSSSSSEVNTNSDKATSHVVSVKHIDDGNAGVAMHHEWTPPDQKELRRLLWKLDLRIVPYVSLLYLVSFLDRVNIGNAKIAGLMEDTNMTEYEYGWSLSIFFVAYIVFEIPSNLALKRLGARIWIPIIMGVWGVIMMAMAAAKSGRELMVARFFLGAAESGLYPGIWWYLSTWYTRRELTTRIAFYFGSSTLAGAFGGVLAYGIMHMKGLQGLNGWQWIFIIEGIPPLILAITSYFVLADGPATASFLSSREREIAVKRLEVDAGPATDTKFSWKECWDGIVDWKINYFALMNLGGLIPMFSISMFMPQIVKDMGFSSINAQAMTVPPYAVAFVICIIVALNADRMFERGWHSAFASFIGVIGYLLLIVLKDKGIAGLYVGTILATIGSFAQLAPRAAWGSGCIGGHTKRAVGVAMISNIGNISGALASTIYQDDDAPHYVRGHAVCLGTCAAVSIMCIALKYILKYINKRRDRLSPEEYQKACQGEHLGDAHPDFRYVH
ncbi:hypothetical protein O0I10_003456 [Lichtheimia ornata]|uniref:Major facilitator superfamily (MFS) profile domain-containing protein n=1 Tax=Lichtheimia ornata TaxID=688661 RepID=A0AAD7V7M4_9FUNG|nr:uncharacterized protein O0I10_003456 [Lichtheimia ornata]KAJ8660813.1 hypothetical protein O0I10_003456 [Lichtheimia ornata]